MNGLEAQKKRLDQLKNTLLSLMDDRRNTAYENARQKAAGPQINEMDYQEVVPPEPDPPEYPGVLIFIVVVLCVLVLIAAFLPSAYRIYIAGHDVFCEAVSDFQDGEAVPEWACITTGIATVALAELGQTVALLAIAVLGTTSYTKEDADEARKKHIKAVKIANGVFWFVAILTTIVAYIGNLHVAKPWEHTAEFFGLFAWILDLFPPTIVIGVMYALKELVLYYVRQNFKLSLAIKQAREERTLLIEDDRRQRYSYLANPEIHPQWNRMYSLALRDELIKLNQRHKGEKQVIALPRLDLMKNLSNEEWKYLIKQEMLANDFTVDPDATTAVEHIQDRIKAVKIPEQVLAKPRQPEQPKAKTSVLAQVRAPVVAQVITEAVGEQVVEEMKGDLWKEENGTWTFKSKYTEKIRSGLVSESEAKQFRYRSYYSYEKRNNLR